MRKKIIVLILFLYNLGFAGIDIYIQAVKSGKTNKFRYLKIWY